MDQISVGERVKELRSAYGFSQRELAKRAGLTHGAISFIERNKISPSVGSLRKILDVFAVTLAEFFSSEAVAKEQWMFRSDELVEVGGNGVSLRQVGRDLQGRPLQVLFEHYEPGAETAPEPYSHIGYEGGVVLKGQLEITVGAETETLNSGDAYLFSSGLPHRFRNVGEEECVVVSASTPPS